MYAAARASLTYVVYHYSRAKRASVYQLPRPSAWSTNLIKNVNNGTHCWSNRLIINHFTLDYHVTNFNAFSRWGTNQNPNPLLCTDPYPNTNQNTNLKHNPNDQFDLLPYMDMLRFIRPKQFLPITCQGSILTFMWAWGDSESAFRTQK